jgi:16S rRNA (adenine1518-N6/adenine1519-N6)-dimethyltransferase
VGRLTLLTQNEWNVEKIRDVPPRAFRPAPKVHSEVVLLRPRPEPLIPETARDPKLWESLLQAAFSQRRKMIHNSLSGNPRFLKALEASGIDGKKRAEALSFEEWGALFRAIQ